MTRANGPLHVLIAGAGVAGLETALALKKLAAERVAVEVLAPTCELVYWPLVVPQEIEFWSDGAFRLHDRLKFTRVGAGWEKTRLYP